MQTEPHPAVIYPAVSSQAFVQSRSWTKTTAESVRYLLAHKAGDEAEKFEAFEHLTAIMLHVSTGLYIPSSVDSNDDSEKYGFIQIFLLEQLAPWLDKTPEVIEEAADQDFFRYLGRKCRQRVLNKIRDAKRLRRTAQFVCYQDLFSAHQPQVCPPRLSFDEFIKMLGECTFLAQSSIETAMALFHLHELRGKQRIEALAEQLGIDAQTAHKHLRNLRKETRAALKAGDMGAKELFDRLAAHIRTADFLPRDLPFWTDGETELEPELNPGSIQMTQFDGYFGKYW
jgi:hypothetical protein